MLRRSNEQGAIHIMYLIMALVIAFAGWGLWFTEFQDRETLQAEAKDATAARDIAQSDLTAVLTAFRNTARVIGGKVPAEIPEPNNAGPAYVERMNGLIVQPMEQYVSEAKSLLSAPATLTTVLGVLDPAEAMINGLKTQIATLTTELTQAKADKATAERANDQLIASHRDELGRRNQDEERLRSTNATREQQLEGQKDEITAKLTDITGRHEKAVNDHRDEILKLRDQTSGLDREVRDIKRNLRIKQETDRPDGNVLDVNEKTGTCWIDIGSKHMLFRGTRFRTYSFAKGQVKEYHGYIVVRDVERDRALCAIEGDGRPFRGDYVTNAFFDREEQKTFFFLGKLPGRFDNQRAKAILESFKGKVADAFSPHVDFLVIGDDPNPEAVGEAANPNWFKETEEYNDALRWNIETLRAKDLEAFLQY